MHRPRSPFGAMALIFILAACGSSASPAASTGGGSSAAPASVAATPDASAIIADLVRLATRMEYAEARWLPAPTHAVRRDSGSRPRN